MSLYKYLAPERADILESGLIRFTHPAALNDPFDLRPRFGTLVTQEEAQAALLEKPPSLATVVEKAYEDLPAAQRVQFGRSEFMKSAAELLAAPDGQSAVADLFQELVGRFNSFAPNLRGQIHSTLDRSVGVLSLSEAWDSQPMWAHYAAQHKGFVLALDPTHGYFSRKRTSQDDFYHLRRVVYRDSATSQQPLSDLDFSAALLEKAASWSYEHEWRMLVPLGDAFVVRGSDADPIHLFRLPGAAIEKVIIGTHASPDLTTSLLRAKRARADLAHLRLIQAQINMDSGSMILGPEVE